MPTDRYAFSGATVSDIALLPDNQILVGGIFSQYNGHAISPYLARLNIGTTIDGYKVECIYGTQEQLNAPTLPMADTCTKNIIVRESTSDNVVQ